MTERTVSFIPEDESLVLLDLEPADKPALFGALLGRVEARGALADRAEALADVLRRETTKPTGLALGVACPHARTGAVNALVVAVARLRRPLDFGAADGAPARHVFLILSPKGAGHPHIEALARIVKCYRDPGAIARLDRAATPAEYLSVLKESACATG